MGETRVDLHHLLEDLRDAYPGSAEETIVTEMVANALDSGASVIRISTDPTASTLTLVDNGLGMRRAELRRYHDIAATTKVRGRGIGFAGVGIKLGLLVSEDVLTETRRGNQHIATSWQLSSKRRAPWSWVEPAGLVDSHGTAVRLRARSALSPLVDRRHLRQILYDHFAPLLDPAFDAILSEQYPTGVRFVLDDRELERCSLGGDDTAPLAIKLPRKRKPSAVGVLIRRDEWLPEAGRGIAISTFGKVIKRGWDWLGISPAEPEKVAGLVEAPALAQCLTLNKADFIRSGQHGALYLAYRKAIQEVVSFQLAEWGLSRDRAEQERRRAARPVERDLEKVLLDLADEFPLLSTLVERRSGGQRRLPLGIVAEGARAALAVAGPEPAHDKSSPESAESPESTDQPESTATEPEPPAASTLDTASRGPRRPARYHLKIEFEQRPDVNELARLAETTVWVNAAHPAYRKADRSRSMGYHLALSTAMALARLAVEPAEAQDFVSSFMARWGETADRRRKARKRKKR
jgi:hypothetical protein